MGNELGKVGGKPSKKDKKSGKKRAPDQPSYETIPDSASGSRPPVLPPRGTQPAPAPSGAQVFTTSTAAAAYKVAGDEEYIVDTAKDINVLDTTASAKASDTSDDMMQDTWRQMIEFNKPARGELKKRLQHVTLYDDEEVPFYNVLLFGMVSHGKTSVINTMASAIIGEVTSLTPAGAGAGGTGESVTREFRMHKFKKKRHDPETVKVRYYDTMGVEATSGIQEADLNYILDGRVKQGYIFTEGSVIDPHNEYFVDNPELKDRIHVVAAVVDAATLDQIGGRALEKIQNYKRIVTARGLPFCVLMTKVDLIFPRITKDDAYTMYFSRMVKDAVDKCGVIFGVPTNQVFPLKNYESEMDTVVAYDILALTTCLKLMHMADGYVRTHLE